MAIATIDPATGRTVKTFEALTATEIEAKLDRADRAFRSYRRTMLVQRSRWLNNAADILERDAERLGAIVTLEMGKPIEEATGEVRKCATVCRYYADRAPEFLADEPAVTDAKFSYVAYQPLGAILAVMPWNFPLWQVFRFAAPALMAGNVGLLKHASNVPQCALAIEDILMEAGFPSGAFQALLVGAAQVETIVRDDRVKGAALTGSEPAGASLASIAGDCIKPTVLELGGSDPFIVMPSADLDRAVETAVTARLLNTGQSCIAAKRFILHEGIADAFIAKLVDKFAALTVGDPKDPTTDIGPLATPTILDEIEQQVNACLAARPKVPTGGFRLDRPGNYFAPTILTDLPEGCPAYRDEFFGPVALTFRVPGLDAAIDLANSTEFGLGACAWTTIDAEQKLAIDRLDAGAVFINGMVKSDPRLPFGGIKKSGYGRELARQGIREFVNIKTVWIGG